MGRRIITKFTMDEISAVKDPAQQGAIVTIMKSRDAPPTPQDEQGYGAELFRANLVKAEQEQPMAKIEPGFVERRTAEIMATQTIPDGNGGQQPVSKRMAEMQAGAEALHQAGLYEASMLVHADDAKIRGDAEIAKRHQPSAELRKARGDFQKRVSEIKARDKCGALVAMERAATEFPDDFAAYQAA